MKWLVIIVVLMIFQLSCKKNEDPLNLYTKFSSFKNVYPLQDSLTIDLKQGDSILIETNLGNLFIKNNYTFNECSEQDKESCDIGATTLLIFSLKSEKMYILNSIESGVSFNPVQSVRLYPCNPQRIPDGPFEYLAPDKDIVFEGVNNSTIKVFYSNAYYSIGNMTIQFRRIYPLSKNLADSKILSKSKLYHAVFTIQKTCR